MKGKSGDEGRLRHILESIEEIEMAVKDLSYEHLPALKIQILYIIKEMF